MGRGCKDQILSQVLIGQSMVAKKSSGMVAAFIDFRKAYDRVDRMKLWDCLGQYGIGGHFLMFLKGLYEGSMSQVRINNRLYRQGICSNKRPAPRMYSVSTSVLYS